jgi:hypothetical protein
MPSYHLIMPPRPRKQLLLKLGVFLLLGAIVNVAVAWGCALGATLRFAGTQSSVVQTTLHVIPSDSVSLNGGNISVSEWRGFGYTHQRLLVRPTPSKSSADQREIWRAGIPTLGLVGVTTHGADAKGCLKYERAVHNLLPYRAIPYRPIWPGFAINTIFYAAMLWMLLFVPGKIRRFIRIRGHRCPACGYIIAPGVGNKCSECGNPLSLRRSAGM